VTETVLHVGWSWTFVHRCTAELVIRKMHMQAPASVGFEHALLVDFVRARCRVCFEFVPRARKRSSDMDALLGSSGSGGAARFSTPSAMRGGAGFLRSLQTAMGVGNAPPAAATAGFFGFNAATTPAAAVAGAGADRANNNNITPVKSRVRRTAPSFTRLLLINWMMSRHSQREATRRFSLRIPFVEAYENIFLPALPSTGAGGRRRAHAITDATVAVPCSRS
jgi:hypothetical protein